MKRFEFDHFILAFCLVGVSACGAFLFNEGWIKAYLDGEQSSGEVIGKVLQSDSDARRRESNTLAWGGVDKGANLFNRDFLFTGRDSSMEIQLDDGSKLSLKENTLILLDRDAQGLVFDLRLGEMIAEVKPRKAFRIKQKNQVAKIKGLTQATKVRVLKEEKAKLTIRPTAQVPVQVQQGSVQTTVQPNKSFSVSKVENKNKPSKMEVSLLHPKRAEALWLAENESVPFKVKAEKPFTGYLQVSRESDFSQILNEKEVDQTKPMAVAADWEPGRYFWRVTGSEKSESYGQSTFTVNSIKAPELVFPPHETSIQNSQNRSDLRFMWMPTEQTEVYQLQIAKDESFRNLVINQKVNADQKTLTLNAGQYFWRVSAKDPEVLKGLWSESYSFQIKGPAPLQAALPEAELAAPYQPEMTTTKAPTIEGSRDPSSISKVAPHLSWKKLEGAKNYIVQISQNADFNGPLTTKTVSAPEFKWDGKKPGKFFWRVQAVDGEKKTPFSKVGSFNFQPPSEFKVFNKTPKKQWVKNPKYEKTGLAKLNWSKFPSSEKYMVEWSSSPKFKKAKKKIVGKNKFRARVPAGKPVFFRVAPIDNKGEKLAPFSKAQKINIETFVALNTPKLEFPADGTSIVSFGGGKSKVVLLWNPVKNARGYEVQFAKDQSFENLHETVNVNENQFVFQNAKKGSTYWRVRAKRGPSSSKWSKPRIFEKN